MKFKLDPADLHPSFRPFRDYLITMVPIIALSTYVYGWRILVMLGISAAVAELSDLIVALLRRNTLDLSDLQWVDYVDNVPVTYFLTDRSSGAIGLEADHLIGVAAGKVKADAIRAVLRGGVLDTLITDTETAEAILAEE